MEQGENPAKSWSAAGGKKGNVAVIAVIIIILLISLGVIGYAIMKELQKQKGTGNKQLSETQKVDDLADWRAYSNEKYGFEVKYPLELNYNENDIPNSVQDSAVKGDGYVGPEVFNATFSKNASDSIIESGIIITIVKRINDEKIVPDDAVEESVVVGGKNGIKYSGSYYIENNGYIYSLSSFGGDSYYDGIFEKILSTFKFTDSAKTGQTYRNEKLGFELTYPQGWFVYDESEKKFELDDVNINIHIQPKEEEVGSIPEPHASALSIGVIEFNGILSDENIKSLESNKSLKYKTEKVLIGGVDGIKATSICEGIGCSNPDWFVVNNGKLYKFYSNLGYSEKFDEIISTVKFTK